MEQQKEYFAFISYKREDEKWAKWLQKKLESYKLPSIVREQRSDLPKYLRPIFRDGTDLSGGILIDQLRRDLLQSRYLIVVCSPNATKSEWVNKEAQTFIDEGRIEQIIPFIIGGTPHADNPADECFPQSLRDIPSDKELLGINVQEVGKDMAFIRLVATMIGVRFDTLWQRHRRDLIRRRIAYGCAAALFCILGLFAWDYNRATYEYFADWVDRYGVPEGILPLTDEQVSHRRRSYQFEYRRIPFGEPNAYSWRVAKVSYVNSAKRPQDIEHTELKDRYPIQEMEYNKQTGVVSRINFYDTKGKVLLRHVLTERDGVAAAVADFVDAQEQRGTGFLNVKALVTSNSREDYIEKKTNIVRFVYDRDEKGHIIKQTYHANNDFQLQRSAISDENGIYGRTFILDSLGRPVKITYLDVKGEPTRARNGISACQYAYDDYGNVCMIGYFDKEGKPILNEKSWAYGGFISDKFGNCMEGFYTDADGDLINTKDGYAKIIYSYDERGNCTFIKYEDKDGNTCNNRHGYAYLLCEYDKKGNCILKSFSDTKMNACINDEGYAISNSKYDEIGNCIATIYMDEDGNPCFSKHGGMGVEFLYDNQSRVIKETYLTFIFDEWYEMFQVYKEYDKNGNLTEEGIVNESNPEKNKIERYYYDERGNCVSMLEIGCDDALKNNEYDFAILNCNYDDYGNILEIELFDEDLNPCMSGWGFSKKEFKYDEYGNINEIIFKDIDGNLTEEFNGIAKILSKYDEKGNRIEESYLGKDGKPCVRNEGYSTSIGKYDEMGNCIEASWLGINGSPIEGVSTEKRLYDEKGLCKERASYDANQRLCLNQYGYSIVRYNYDERGNCIERSLYGKDNKPCMCTMGMAKVTYKYDKYDNQTEEAYYDTEGDPIDALGFYRKVDSYGKITSEKRTIYYNSKNQILNKSNETLIVIDVNSQALSAGLPSQSTLLQWNGWKVGDSGDSLNIEINNSKYGIKELYFITKKGEIKHLSIRHGLAGIEYMWKIVEKSQADEWMKKLEAWKKEHGDK